MAERTNDNIAADSRVRDLLDGLEMKYRVGDNGTYSACGALGNGRRQVGHIRSDTFTVFGLEMRQIFSVALKSFGPFDARTANLLLRQNEELRIGAWSIETDSDGDNEFAIFSATVPANLEEEHFWEVLCFVMTVADQMEERLSGRDDY